MMRMPTIAIAISSSNARNYMPVLAGSPDLLFWVKHALRVLIERMGLLAHGANLHPRHLGNLPELPDRHAGIGGAPVPCSLVPNPCLFPLAGG